MRKIRFTEKQNISLIKQAEAGMSIKEQFRKSYLTSAIKLKTLGLTNSFALLRAKFRLDICHLISQLKLCKRNAYLSHQVNLVQLHESLDLKSVTGRLNQLTRRESNGFKNRGICLSSTT